MPSRKPHPLGALVSSNTHEHPTPRALFDALDHEFGPFDFDPCTRLDYPSAQTILARGGTVCTLEGTFTGAYMQKLHARGGLSATWHGRVFLNPPYGRECWRWVQRAYKFTREPETRAVDLVCALLPVRSDQRWYQKYIAAQIGRTNGGAANRRQRHGFRVDVEGEHVPADLIRHLPQRVRYGTGARENADGVWEMIPVEWPKAGAPFPSVVVVWRRV